MLTAAIIISFIYVMIYIRTNGDVIKEFKV